jgi:DNA polymerase elongation subunit (family B)
MVSVCQELPQSTSTGLISLQDVAYQIKGGKPIVYIFGRHQNGTATVDTIQGFEPYFYVPSGESDRALELPGTRLGESYTDVYGRSVTRVYTVLPGDVSNYREYGFSFTDESDILFDRRVQIDTKLVYNYTSDNGIISPVESSTLILPRVMLFDIEVRNPRGEMPNPQTSLYPVASIQIGDSYSKKIYTLTYGIPTKQRPNHIPCQSELELFETFYQLIKKLNPDVYAGWYSNNFDIPYLIRRATVIGARTKGLARINDCKCNITPSGKWLVRIPGRQSFDMLDAFKKLTGSEGERDAYDLKTISKSYGMPYHDYGADIDSLLSNSDYSTFLDYCENDVKALMLIDEKSSMFQFYESEKSITGCRLEDTMYNSRIIEIFLMHKGIAPMPRKQHIVGEKFPGATVVEPTSGIHHNVGCVDLKSLYPTIMRAFNLSPDVQKLIPKVLTFIVEERDRLRAINKTKEGTVTTHYQEMVMKYLANSFYGILGSDTFRLYDKSVAESVTRYGREISAMVRDVITSYGKTIDYGDTDSVFFSPILSPEEGLEIESRLNVMLSEWSKSQGCSIDFSLKFEKLYETLMFKRDSKGLKDAKKKYAGKLIWYEGKAVNQLNFTGLEIKRSDQAIITKDIVREFLEIALMQDNLDGAVHYVKTLYNKVKEGNVSIYDISIPKGVHSDRDDPHVRGVYNARSLYKHVFDPAIKPRLLYLRASKNIHNKEYETPRELCIDDTFTPDILSTLKIDYTEHAEKTVRRKMESYMLSIGYTWDQVVNGQKSLFEF